MSEALGEPKISLDATYWTSTVIPTSKIPLCSPVLKSPVPGCLEAKMDHRYYLEFVDFLVEDTFFRVPKYQFNKQPSHFWDINKTVIDKGGVIKLEDIRKEDFAALLRFLYPDAMENTEPHSFAEWNSILELTSKWKMYKFFDIAVAALRKAPLHEQVLFARKYGVYNWLKSVYIALAEKHAFFSRDEATALGLAAALKLIYIRENYYRLLPSLDKDKDDYPQKRSNRVPPISTEKVVYKEPDDEISREIASLGQIDAAPAIVEQIVMGRKCGYVQWVEHGYQALLDRSESISFHEGSALGLEITTDLCNRREQEVRKNKNDPRVRSDWAFPPDLIDLSAEVIVRFEDELNRLEEINGTYGKPFQALTPQPDSKKLKGKKTRCIPIK